MEKDRITGNVSKSFGNKILTQALTLTTHALFKKLHYMMLQLESKDQNVLSHVNIKQRAMPYSTCFNLTTDVKC